MPNIFPSNPRLTIQPRPNGLPRLIDQDTRIVIEFNHTPIRSLQLLLRPYHNRMSNVSSANFVGCRGGNACAGA